MNKLFDSASVIRIPMRWTKALLVDLGYHSRPSFMIIGAQKAGTTALYKILNQHPQVIAPQEKEIHYFDEFKLRYKDHWQYHTRFPLPYRLMPNKVTFEASPSYLYHPECPRRIYDYSPEMLFIVILREPVARAFSAWQMYCRFRKAKDPVLRKLAESRSFEQAVKEEIDVLQETSWYNNPIAYVKRGIYVEQLERYFQYFPRGSFLILAHNELVCNMESILKEICTFLGIDERFYFTPVVANSGRYNERIPDNVSQLLYSLYKPYNQKLFSLLGKAYDW